MESKLEEVQTARQTERARYEEQLQSVDEQLSNANKNTAQMGIFDPVFSFVVIDVFFFFWFFDYFQVAEIRTQHAEYIAQLTERHNEALKQ